MKKKIAIKQRAHVVNIMAPTLLCECYDLKHVKCKKGKKVYVLLQISWVEVFVYEKIFQNKLNAKRCEIKVLYQTLFMLLTIVQRCTHIRGWITIV
jgi:hypothetical protein